MRTIETPRLILRPFTTDDAAGMHPLFCDHEAMRLVGMLPSYDTMEQTEQRLARWGAHDRHLALQVKETGSVIGYIVVNPDSEEGRADTRELGFALTGDCRGRGYMREAVTAVIEALREDGIRYVWACCFTENSCSERLIRAMGFTLIREGSYAAPNDRTYTSLEFRLELDPEQG